MRATLTQRLVHSTQPQERPYELRDTQVRGLLLLRVQPSGHKAWIIEWTRGKRRTLGALGHLTLDQARAHASQAMAEYIQRGLPSIAKPKRLKRRRFPCFPRSSALRDRSGGGPDGACRGGEKRGRRNNRRRPLREKHLDARLRALAGSSPDGCPAAVAAANPPQGSRIHTLRCPAWRRSASPWPGRPRPWQA